MADIRHQHRIKIVQNLFSHSFKKSRTRDKNIVRFDKKTLQIIEKKEKIHEYIQKYASRFPLEHISKVDLAVLELSVYELLYEKKQPPKVIIDEAIELAKEFGGERSFAFINAILGKIYNETYAH